MSYKQCCDECKKEIWTIKKKRTGMRIFTFKEKTRLVIGAGKYLCKVCAIKKFKLKDKDFKQKPKNMIYCDVCEKPMYGHCKGIKVKSDISRFGYISKTYSKQGWVDNENNASYCSKDCYLISEL